jgi:sarcosine oxidase
MGTGVQIIEPALFQPENFPIFIYDTSDGRPLYGFPELAPHTGFKFGKMFHFGEIVDPDTMLREVTTEDEEELRRGVETYFPKAAGRVLSETTCMFTHTPDHHFLVDLHPNHPQVRR